MKNVKGVLMEEKKIRVMGEKENLLGIWITNPCIFFFLCDYMTNTKVITNYSYFG